MLTYPCISQVNNPVSSLCVSVLYMIYQYLRMHTVCVYYIHKYMR